jgi:crotonobetainyl-CoA:carnitine CoA-transferase CaiB-like acyl-CoA transferase
MIGKDLAALLEGEGFSVVRRSQSYVWLGRGKDVLLVDLDADLSDEVAEQLLARAREHAP